MKKIVWCVISIIASLSLVSCTVKDSSDVIEFNFQPKEHTSSKEYDIDLSNGDPNVDMDLTQLNSVLLFAQLANMKVSPDEHVGKTIKISGFSDIYYDENADVTYHSVINYDSTACCSSGLDFIMSEGLEYPEKDKKITVIGTLEKYNDPHYGTTYRLMEASLE